MCAGWGWCRVRGPVPALPGLTPTAIMVKEGPSPHCGPRPTPLDPVPLCTAKPQNFPNYTFQKA